MPAGNNYTVTRIRQEDMPGLEKLFRKVYQRPVSPGYFKRKLATGYTGLDNAGFIASSSENEVVAVLCVVPCTILVNGKRIKAAQLTDGMTDSFHRRNGLFGELVTAIIELAKQSGIELLFGFPNQDSYQPLLKNGWEQQQQLDRFVIPVERSALWLFRRLTGLKLLKSGERPDNIHSVIRDGFDGIDRNPDHITYKLSLSNYGLVKTTDGKAWAKTGSDLSIGDMNVEDEGFERLLKKVYREAVRNGVYNIHFQCSRGSRLHYLFSRRYRAIPSFPVLMKKINPDLDTGRIKFTYADIDIF
jgi:hypothetical protein